MIVHGIRGGWGVVVPCAMNNSGSHTMKMDFSVVAVEDQC